MATSLVNNKYRITRRIGGGSFGEIYLGVGPSGEKVGKILLLFRLTRCLISSYLNIVGRSKVRETWHPMSTVATRI